MLSNRPFLLLDRSLRDSHDAIDPSLPPSFPYLIYGHRLAVSLPLTRNFSPSPSSSLLPITKQQKYTFFILIKEENNTVASRKRLAEVE